MTPLSLLPTIDMTPLLKPGLDAERNTTVGAIEAACRNSGFFYVAGHCIAPETIGRLATASRRFFALPSEEKAEIAMARGGAAWDGASVHEFSGTYGAYLMRKVAKVFLDLGRNVGLESP